MFVHSCLEIKEGDYFKGEESKISRTNGFNRKSFEVEKKILR